MLEYLNYFLFSPFAFGVLFLIIYKFDYKNFLLIKDHIYIKFRHLLIIIVVLIFIRISYLYYYNHLTILNSLNMFFFTLSSILVFILFKIYVSDHFVVALKNKYKYDPVYMTPFKFEIKFFDYITTLISNNIIESNNIENFYSFADIYFKFMEKLELFLDYTVFGITLFRYLFSIYSFLIGAIMWKMKLNVIITGILLYVLISFFYFWYRIAILINIIGMKIEHKLISIPKYSDSDYILKPLHIVYSKVLSKVFHKAMENPAGSLAILTTGVYVIGDGLIRFKEADTNLKLGQIEADTKLKLGELEADTKLKLGELKTEVKVAESNVKIAEAHAKTAEAHAKTAEANLRLAELQAKKRGWF